MILSRTKDRIVRYWKENDGSIIIQEKEAFTPIGYSKRRWSDNRVALSLEEFTLLAKKVMFAEEGETK